MLDSALYDSLCLPLEQERQVDNLCDEFEASLQHGNVPDVEEYLARVSPEARRFLMKELAKLVQAYAHGRSARGAGRTLEKSSVGPQRIDSKSPSDDADDTTRAYLRRSLQLLRQVNLAGKEFERALARGDQYAIEEIVEQADAAVRPRLLRELLKLEMEFRARKGERPRLQSYRERFPADIPLVKYLYFENFVPARIGEFTIEKLLGRGGFGHVYQGWDNRLSRSVAIKVFRRDPSEQRTGNDELMFEARSAAQLGHPGIVTVHAVQVDADGDEFLVLEYIDGQSLEDLLRSRRLAPLEAAELMLAVTLALKHSHEQGLIHRDLKPANIMLDQGNRPRVTDFGLALHLSDLRRSADLAGTLPYMSPEQANGETHLLDARTDLWAVGVTLYRALTGWLPFAGGSRQDLLDAIRHHEPKDLLQHDATLPAELARIVRRCLAKRMSDRYQTAAELAEDLRAYLSPDAGTEHTKTPAGADTAAAVVAPKGLRCFERVDHASYLKLVPGPRDRRGVPEAIRFWEKRLGDRHPGQTFRVGLLYGPSGCGKSSLVRAGVLPTLGHHVRVLIVEASHDDTESRLRAELRRLFSDLPTGLSLADLLAEIREGQWLPPGDKLVVVIDQFEQWLHGHRQTDSTELIDALRQCDGARLQSLVLVRDDFWVPVTRLFRQLDIPLAEGSNAAPVDLFNRDHAVSVLNDFGVAFGKLPVDQSKRTEEQTAFLRRAIDVLSVGGWVMPVRLCILAEIMKSRPWTLDTLRDFGGAEGLGAEFLEEMFDGKGASIRHRRHRAAARNLLERLLPPAGTDIRGHLVAEEELIVACGYAAKPEEFAELIRCLDHEMRLITPSAAEHESGDPGATTIDSLSYQLTHDYLVPAIRAWLNRNRRQSIRGRAELRLTEYADAYASHPDARQLPSWWEWLTILAATNARNWKTTEQEMMRAASHRFLIRGCLAVALVVAAALGIYNRIAQTRAEGLVSALKTSDSRDLPGITRLLAADAARVRPLLKGQLGAATEHSDPAIRLSLGLVAVGEPVSEKLLEQLFQVPPALGLAIVEVLHDNKRLQELDPYLRTTASDPSATTGKRLRAAMALVQLPLPATADPLPYAPDRLIRDILSDSATNPEHIAVWSVAFVSSSKLLIEPLKRAFRNGNLSETERLMAATLLTHYATDNVPLLLDLALAATPKQFEQLSNLLTTKIAQVRPELVREVESPSPLDASDDKRDDAARRKANARLLLGAADAVERVQWIEVALRRNPDPRVRSYLLDYYRASSAPRQWLTSLADESDPGACQAKIVALTYSFDPDNPSAELNTFNQILLSLFQEHSDPGVHSAAEWAMRRLGRSQQLEQALNRLSEVGRRAGYRWFVTPSKITMAIVDPPGDVTLGSPLSELGRDASDESQWHVTISEQFAISTTEITQAQYLAIMPEYRCNQADSAPHLRCPANAVSAIDIDKFCEALSERDGLAGRQPSEDTSRDPESPSNKRILYRLPTEAEWEIACRAGTLTPRYFGFSPELLPQYVWYIANSEARTRPVGQCVPNDWGLFDTLGNVSEWCADTYATNPGSSSPPKTPFRSLAYLVVRGGDFNSLPGMVRAANRKNERAQDTAYSRGFRIAQTLTDSQVGN